MATAYKAVNVTKYDTGGPDNIIDDGLIKSTEQVWADSYALTGALANGDTIVIARVPPGKRITDVIACYPALTTEKLDTGSTLAVGVTGDLDKFIDDVETGVFLYETNAAASTSTITNIQDHVTMARMDNADGFQYLTTGSTFTPILLSIGRKATTTASGTIKTIVKYV